MLVPHQDLPLASGQAFADLPGFGLGCFQRGPLVPDTLAIRVIQNLPASVSDSVTHYRHLANIYSHAAVIDLMLHTRHRTEFFFRVVLTADSKMTEKQPRDIAGFRTSGAPDAGAPARRCPSGEVTQSMVFYR